ncbi:Putative secreted esterase [Corynebacterium glyciniphilum AJ 3170]|uniref:Putative secreted esterase n=1 Tax=Corynebacterium glyciniphilum AJ 3170 TaxID=1404245 RepID=X5ED53_9CORY|nr:GDSL-type esterase/lipase family protein [Corynebacterium glyciniphilum]AHW65290.1 Putative secreted esterase [Corynebacterium glyciniphilum AJ 3170]
MRRFTRATRVLATCLLLSATVGSATATAGVALPASTKVVTYGDSYTANPSQLVGMANQYEQLKPFLTDYPRTGQLESGKECLQAPDNWPRLLQDEGMDVRDWSCTAQTSRTMLDRIDASIAAGDLTADTDSVIFPVGLNNFGPWGQKDGMDVTDFDAVQDAYAADMREAARRVRAVAPEASLVVSGMPQIGHGDTYCIVNVVPDHPQGLSVPYLAKAENAVQAMQRQSATEIGAQFVDLKSASQGHDTCAPDAERYIAGLIDTTTPDYKMIIHPSQAGQRFIAAQLGAAV